jgi:hypothetical protein
MIKIGKNLSGLGLFHCNVKKFLVVFDLTVMAFSNMFSSVQSHGTILLMQKKVAIIADSKTPHQENYLP